MPSMSDFNTSINELKNVAQFIAQKLEDMILSGELTPGHHLVQTDIATQFGVSRLPVRDALKILEKRELAVTQPRRGIIVRPLKPQEVTDLYELRLLLESHAFAQSAKNLTPADIAAAEAIIRQQEAHQMDQFLVLLALDEQFHFQLFARCTNAETKAYLAKIWGRIRVLRSLARDEQDWNKNSIKSHRAILSAIRAKDFKKARTLLEEGILAAEGKILASVTRLSSKTASANAPT